MILDMSGKINPEDSSSSATLLTGSIFLISTCEREERAKNTCEKDAEDTPREGGTRVFYALASCSPKFETICRLILPTLSKINVLPLKPPSSNEVALILVCPAHSYSTKTS